MRGVLWFGLYWENVLAIWVNQAINTSYGSTVESDRDIFLT